MVGELSRRDGFCDSSERLAAKLLYGLFAFPESRRLEQWEARPGDEPAPPALVLLCQELDRSRGRVGRRRRNRDEPGRFTIQRLVLWRMVWLLGMGPHVLFGLRLALPPLLRDDHNLKPPQILKL